MSQLFWIARNNLTGKIKNKYFWGVFSFLLAVVGSSVYFGVLTYGDRVRVIKDIGFVGIFIFGLLFLLTSTVKALSDEIEKKTVYGILTRGVDRTRFILGLACGEALVLAGSMLVLAAVLWLLLGYQTGSFSAEVFLVVGMMYLELILLISFAFFLATFMTREFVPFGVIIILMVGHWSDSLLFLAEKADSAALSGLLKGLYYVLPNLELFNISNQVLWGTPLGPATYLTAVLYAILYSGIFLILATAVFKRREL